MSVPVEGRATHQHFVERGMPVIDTPSIPLDADAHNTEARNVGGLVAISDEEFDNFRKLIHRHAGIHLTTAKRDLVRSRLAKRLRHFGFATYGAYYEHLRRHDPQGEELQQMINCITTNKTEFFREPHHFDFLRRACLPELQRAATEGGRRRVRIWSAACSMGQEPYSLAMTLREHFGSATGWDLRILASDIDTNVLAAAAEGIYPLAEIDTVPEDLRRRHLLKGTGSWAGHCRVRPETQSLVTFRQINLIEEPWPIRTRFDVVFCRNVFIYFNRQTQERILERMAQVLTPRGYLILGHSENLFWSAELFESLGNTIYRLRA